MWLIVLILLPAALLLLFFIVYAICDWLRRKSVNYEEIYFQPNNSKPKIGAEVSDAFYREVKLYCSRHKLSISDLIRKAVRSYMDSNR